MWRYFGAGEWDRTTDTRVFSAVFVSVFSYEFTDPSNAAPPLPPLCPHLYQVQTLPFVMAESSIHPL